VSILVGRANRAYAANDTAQTITLFTEIIRHDPYVISAWNTLASVLEEEGKTDEAWHLRFCAAHVEDEADTWKELARDFRKKGQIDVCVYCLRKALSKDQSDLAVLFELAAIYRLKKEASKVRLFLSNDADRRPSICSKRS
jgi:general transcription factor 3C polypeptide 3 (transcription factor C subunit 4)